MKSLKLSLPVGIGLALAVLAGCSTPTGPVFDARAPVNADGVAIKNDLNPAWLQSGTNFFTLGPGDVVEMEILGQPITRASVAVGPDGKIYFQFLPGLDVWGLTLTQTKNLMERELGKYISGSPQVSVALKAVGSKYIWMLGQVTRPGVYPMSGATTLLEAISMAGGTTRAGPQELADLRHSFVQRHGEIVPVDFRKLLLEGDMSQNIYLQPDDFIYLPSTLLHEVFVLGAVRIPRSVPFTEHLTLVSAITAASGTQPGAYASHVAIVRGSLSEPKVAIIDYSKITAGKAPDVRLEPHDIVYVPTEPFTTLRSYGRAVLSVFVNTVAANEGANAVINNANSVGIAVPPVSP